MDRDELHAAIYAFSDWCREHKAKAIVCVCWLDDKGKVDYCHSSSGVEEQRDLVLDFQAAYRVIEAAGDTGKLTRAPLGVKPA